MFDVKKMVFFSVHSLQKKNLSHDGRFYDIRTAQKKIIKTQPDFRARIYTVLLKNIMQPLEHTQTNLRRPTNSKKLRIVSIEYARNEEFYRSVRDSLIDDYWYLVDKQKIVAFDLDKKKVIVEVAKLENDDHLLVRKGHENEIYIM